jgi:uncharacterized membrane protein
MKKNMGSIDKTLRIIFALLIAILFYLKVITGTFGIVLLVLDLVLVQVKKQNKKRQRPN